MNVVGYVTPRGFGLLSIPVPAQNSCLREFAASVDLPYVLPPLEHTIPGSYMQLFTAINMAQSGDIVAMYSLLMFPSSLVKLNHIFELAVGKKISFYFVLESRYIVSLQSFLVEYQSYEMRNLLDYSSQASVESIRMLSADA